MEFIEMLGNISVISVILFIAGIGLIAAELYQPGFGILGGLGLICLIACILLTAQTLMQGVILTAAFIVLVVLILIVFIVLVSKNRYPKRLVLHESTSAELGFSGTQDMNHLLGKSGTVTTVCRPAGNADFEGVKHDVVSRGEYIERGTEIEVVEIEGSRIVVRAKS